MNGDGRDDMVLCDVDDVDIDDVDIHDDDHSSTTSTNSLVDHGNGTTRDV